MTADEFVTALAEIGKSDVSKRVETRLWTKIRKRKKPAFEHPPDPILDLLARYDVSKVRFLQIQFSENKIADYDQIWHVATKATDDFFVESGRVLKMYYKECFPSQIGLSSGQFLELILIYAKMLSLTSENSTGPFDPVLVEYSEKAHALGPGVAPLDWFWETGRR